MQIIYIYHSGFAILGDGVTVIIDYFRDTLPNVRDKGIVQQIKTSIFAPMHFTEPFFIYQPQRRNIRNLI